jgi:hypothetical protein
MKFLKYLLVIKTNEVSNYTRGYIFDVAFQRIHFQTLSFKGLGDKPNHKPVGGVTVLETIADFDTVGYKFKIFDEDAGVFKLRERYC